MLVKFGLGFIFINEFHVQLRSFVCGDAEALTSDTRKNRLLSEAILRDDDKTCESELGTCITCE